MIKPKIIDMILFVLILLVLDTLYLLPLYLPLDAKPDSTRSATYLAKSVAKKAQCETNALFLSHFHNNTKNKVLDFMCTIGEHYDALFIIYVFLDEKTKNEMIQLHHNSDTRKVCFKKGTAYIVCEPDIQKDAQGKDILREEKYYQQFPGEPIEYKRD